MALLDRSQAPTRSHYRLVDADTHVNEPPDLWRSRVPERFRDRAPKMETFEEGDAWVLEDVADPINFGLNACAGMDPEQMKGWIRWEDIRPGGYDPAARIAEMDRDQVDAHVLYPTPRLSHSIIANRDAEFHLALVQAYNDWIAEYAQHEPDRLGGLALLPNRGVDLAARELDRVLEMPGIVGVIAGAYPHGDLQITAEDDVIWERLAEAGLPLHIHVSMVDQMPAAHSSKIVGDVRFYDAPTRILQFVWSRVFDRVPGLKLVVAEVDAGWVPYFKEQVDDRFRRLGRGARVGLSAPPSEYIAEHVYFTYITDHLGIRLRQDIGVERMMWSSDYPHVGSDWPNSWRTIAADYSGVARDERDLMLAGNAQRLYRFGQ